MKRVRTGLFLRIGSELLIGLFCRGRFRIVGETPEEGNIVVASSHFSNLDSYAAIKTFGRKMNLHFTVESVHFRSIPHLLIMFLGGIKNFSPLSYKRLNEKGLFNPSDFQRLAKRMEEGKTPWIAAHQFTNDGRMKRADIGFVYLAQKTGARIIPVALEIHGATVNLEGWREWVKGLFGGMSAIYHIGEPVTLTSINIGIIENMLQKRTRGETISPEEKKEFGEIHNQLRQQADRVARIIASMLPEKQKGYYNQ